MNKISLVIKHKNGNEMTIYYQNDKQLYKALRRLDKKLKKVHSVTALYSTGRRVELTTEIKEKRNAIKFIVGFALTFMTSLYIIVKYLLEK